MTKSRLIRHARRAILRLTGTAAIALALNATPAAGFAPAAQSAAPACKGVDGYASAFEGRRTFLWAPDVLIRLKAKRDSDPAIKAAYDGLLAKAEAAMKRPLFTVVDKRTVPPSGDRHDYLSIVGNWFPDPAKPDGPYIRGEGTNPERLSNKFDIADLDRMSADIETLSLAYYFSDNPRYATRAASLARTWFLDPASRMNPNMNYAQTVPGREIGHADGVLETARLQRVIEGLGLIAPSGKLTPEETKGMEKWFSDYVDWMRGSTHGRNASIANSYQSMWYDSQITQFALFARRPDVVKSVVEAFPKRRFATQFSVDGKLPIDLARSRSLYYSIFTLQAAYNAAEIGSCIGLDLWNVDSGGKSLRGATDFLAAYRGKLETWPYPEANPVPGDLDDLLYRANRAWGDAYPSTPRAELVRYLKL